MMSTTPTPALWATSPPNDGGEERRDLAGLGALPLPPEGGERSDTLGTPSPSRLRLDTSPPNDGGEDAPAASLAPILSPHEVGERCRALSRELVERSKGETERGNLRPKSRRRRKPGTTERARSLRWIENSAEGALWLELKGRKLGGYHFTRQHPIGPYFADFCCRKQRLVVEIDGSQHADNPRDRVRDEFMRAQGYSVLRVWNTDVLKHRRAVCETILAALDGRLTGDVAASDLRYVYAPPASGSSTPLIGTHP